MSDQFKSLAFIVASLLLLPGCTNQSDPLIDMVDATADVIEIDDIERAINRVSSSQGFEIREFEESTTGSLNRWVAKSLAMKSDKPAETWKLNEVLRPIAEEFQTLPSVARMADLSFLPTDPNYLRQSNWCESVKKRVLTVENPIAFEFLRLAAGEPTPTKEPNKDFLGYIKTLHPSLDDAQASVLADTYKLFDWVIRNSQLDPEVEPVANTTDNQSLVESPTGKPWFDGIRSTGYVRTPMQLLTFGRGDFVERSKLFMKLLEHNQTNSILLAVKGKPWAVGVKIGNELFLFDCKLGLPIPFDKPGSVATLSQVRANPELLGKLDLTLEESVDGDNKYWVKADQLKELDGLIYVSPESVSHRMAYLEQRLVGDNKMLLTQNVSKLLETFSGIEGVVPAIWDVDFKNHAFRQTLRAALAQAQDDDVLRNKLTWYYDNESYVDGFENYRTARNMFVHGEFESQRNSEEFNAIENFYVLMYQDKTIDNLATNKGMLLRLGILQGQGQSASQFQERLRGVQSQMRLVRRDAGLFLAQSLFDKGNAGTAGNWLDRISVLQDSGRWTGGIRYLLARTLESRREFDRAIAELAKSESTQKHGDLLRMRFLKSLVPQVPVSSTPSETNGN